jgi:hypothetical protein
VSQRGLAPFQPIQAYVKRQNVIPEEDPTKAPNGVTIPYVKRQGVIPEEDPTKAPNGVTIPYQK